ncbi:DUF4395 domain-containing protein [Sulfurovum sp.]|uniref:DUF4395 domain-containing protein n=1 Tax=Sulfurovum sp. TaxID=1969726 RepID=UPI003562F123
MSNIIERKFEIIDESQIRIVAALVAISIVAYLFLGYISLLILLIYHFFIQLYLTPLLSPLELIASYISSSFTHERYSKDTSGKEFATHIALIIVSVSIVLEVLKYTKLASTLILLLVVWKILEATKNICLGCKLYELLQRKGIKIISL